MFNLIKHNTKISKSEKGSCYTCKLRQMDIWPIIKGYKFSRNNSSTCGCKIDSNSTYNVKELGT
jgi:hypothetical protein